MFTLEALPAAQGDCLLLHYGTAGGRELILVDGGPPGVFKNALKPRLEELRAASPGADALLIQLAIVSHIDSDHVAGVADLLKAIDKARPSSTVEIRRLWHNAFRAITDSDRLAPSLTSGEGGGGGGDVMHGIVASTKQGDLVAQLATALGIHRNNAQPLLTAGAEVQLPDDDTPVTVRATSPDAAQIDALREAWAKDIHAPGVVPAAYLDDSAWNLSSIVTLVSRDGRQILLTGDARGDEILRGLKAQGLLDAAGKLHVDILKLPHHGSDRNVATDFFRDITADHYVISGNGMNGNPEPATLTMIAEARGDAEYTVWCTYETGSQGLGKHLQDWRDAQQAAGRPSTLVTPASGASIVIDLDPSEPLTP